MEQKMIFDNADRAIEAFEGGAEFVLFNGDCKCLLPSIKPESADLIVTSPPYFMGKSYDTSYDLNEFISDHKLLRSEIIRILSQSGSLAWQVGHHVRNGVSVPLDFHVYGAFTETNELVLRNRIIWTFNHGLHAAKRFSGRHETIMWFTKTNDYFFNLDAVRVPQKYPGKRHYSGPKKGELSGNPLGKNPGDVWDIPNVKANHPEKTPHPCQFPVGLVERLVKSMTKTNGTVVDPFAGSGSTGIAAVMNGRRFLGAELNTSFCEIAESRYAKLKKGSLKTRSADQPVYEPTDRMAVARRPDHFA